MSDRIPDKVTIVCTADGFSVTVESGDHELATERHRMTGQGHAKTVGGEIDWFDVLPNDRDLADRLDDLTHPIFAVASELYDIRDEFGSPKDS